jgi:hypothetical protein
MLCGMSGRPSAGDFKANSLRRRDTPLQSTDNRCVTRAVAQIPRGEPFRQDADLQDEFPAQRRCELRGAIDGYRERRDNGSGIPLAEYYEDGVIGTPDLTIGATPET